MFSKRSTLFFCSHTNFMMQELKSLALYHKRAVNELQRSMRCMEIMMCSNEGTKPLPSSPASGDTVNLENDGVDEAGNSMPHECNDVDTKRKAIIQTQRGVNSKDIFNLSDDEHEIIAKKQCHSLPPIKVDGLVVPCKPKIPQSWTHESRLHKDPLMVPASEV